MRECSLIDLPLVYDVMVKNNSKDDEKSLAVLEWKTFR